MSIKLQKRIDQFHEEFDEVADELYRLSNLMTKRPNHPACKIWHRQSQSKLSESKFLIDSMKLLGEIIMVDIISNVKLLNARVSSEHLRYSSSATNIVDNIYREDLIGERFLVQKKNIETAKDLRTRLEKVNDATKKIIHHNYECCSSCESMFNKSFLPFFGIVEKNCSDLPSTSCSFICFECNDSKQKTRIEGLTECRATSISKKKSKKRKKKKKSNRQKTQVQILTPKSNDDSNLQAKKDNVPKSPTSIMSLHMHNPLVENIPGFPKVQIECSGEQCAPIESCNVTTDTVENSKSTDVSNDDFVDYLLECGSILALDKYMDELGLDYQGESLGESIETM